ncbi:MAG: hypothetical protein Q8N81_03775, partial [bacterium]|nr:hypothetical protein [bacterium]
MAEKFKVEVSSDSHPAVFIKTSQVITTLVLSLAIVVLDQVTKHAIRYSFSLGESKTVIASLF